MNLENTKQFGVHLDVTLKVIKQDLIKRFREKGIELTPEQWTLLSSLAKNGTIYQRELAEGTFKDAPTVSRIIELLRKRGFITRKADKVDRRRFLITLTHSGQEVYERSAPIVHDARVKGWKNLSNADYEQLLRILSQVAENITKAE